VQGIIPGASFVKQTAPAQMGGGCLLFSGKELSPVRKQPERKKLSADSGFPEQASKRL